MRHLKTAAKMRLALFTLCAATLIASLPGTALAQLPELSAGGPFVMPDLMGNPTVTPGRSIEWSVAGTNIQPAPLTARITTEPQNTECDPGGMNTEYGVFGAAQESEPQSYLSFVDNNADGDCNDPGESVVLDMGAPTVCLLMAPSGQQRLEFNDVTIPAFGAYEVSWITDVSDMAAPPNQLCSWAHIVNADTGDLVQSTRVPGSGMDPPACTCVFSGEDQGFDAEVTKVGTPDTLPLVPGDPGATITYEITVTNTGSQDLTMWTMNDSLMPDNFLEWTEIVTCDAPLVCSDIVADPTVLTVTGWEMQPLEMDGTCAPGNTCTQTVVARALVTCAIATDDDSGEVCNQAEFSLAGMATFPSDDPATPVVGDPTCTPVVFSNLTDSTKRVVTFDDGNGNGQLDAGERVTFEINALNSGRWTATNVVVTDDLSAAGCWRPGSIDASASGGVVTGDSIEWMIGDLGPSASQALTFTVVLDTDTLCCNQASIQSDDRVACGLNAAIVTDDPSTATLDDETCASPGPQPDLVIEKTWCVVPEPAGGCPGEAVIGDNIAYTITITNNGPGVATNAELRDDFNLYPCNTGFLGEAGLTVTTTDGMDWGDASTSRNDSGGFPRDFGEIIITNLGGANGIQPGETITVDWVNVNRTNVNGCCNQAFVSFAEASEPQPSDDPSTPGRPDDATCLNAAAVTEGELEKTATLLDVAGGAPDGFISIGDEVVYTFSFTNVGSEIMTNVAITDMAPACAGVDSATVMVLQDDTGTFVDSSAGGNVDVSIATISPAETVVFTVSGTITEVITGCCNQAAWTSDQAVDGGEGLSDRDLSDFAPEQETCFNTVDVPMPMLSWVKSSDAAAGCNAPGTTVNYTLTITNNGSGPVDTWDIVDDVAPLGGCAAVTPTAPLTCDAGTDTLIVDSAAEGPVDAMGGMKEYTYSVDLPCDAAGGNEDPAGDFNYDTGGGPITLSDTAGAVEWGWPDLSTSGKVFNWDAGDMNGDGRMDAGAENAFSYTISVNNSGSCAATGVTLTDIYPADFVITDPGTGVDDGTTITWDLGDIAAGGSVMVTFTAMIDEMNPPMPGNIPNSFSVTATNDAPACAGVLPAPELLDEAESTGGVPWGVVPDASILRNGLVSCLAEATTVYDVIFDGGAEPQIDAAAAGTSSTPAAASPVVFAGDNDTAASNDVCPQEDPAGANLDNRVLVFYEYTGDPLTVISVTKNGADVEVSW